MQMTVQCEYCTATAIAEPMAIPSGCSEGRLIQLKPSNLPDEWTLYDSHNDPTDPVLLCDTCSLAVSMGEAKRQATTP